jgi:hypothetical protein
MTKKGAITGSHINKEHEEKVRKIREQWAMRACEGAIAILYPHLEV